MEPGGPEREPASVRAMFDSLAGRYDLLNSILSGGRDAHWRRRAAQASGLQPGGTALDVACGSGRLAAELKRRAGGGVVVGIDFSRRMLQIAQDSARGPVYARSDALALPFPDDSFDAVTVAFGLRNFVRPGAALAEMLRVIRPGARALVLEFVQPRPGLVGALYRTYLRHGLPRVGGAISGQAHAYRYLSQTVDSYHSPAELVALASASGWSEVTIELLTLGTVGLLVGHKPQRQLS